MRNVQTSEEIQTRPNTPSLILCSNPFIHMQSALLQFCLNLCASNFDCIAEYLKYLENAAGSENAKFIRNMPVFLEMI